MEAMGSLPPGLDGKTGLLTKNIFILYYGDVLGFLNIQNSNAYF